MKQKNMAWIAAVALLSAGLTALLGYRVTLGEPDMASVVMGIVYGGVTGDPHAAKLQYGMSFSFGFYQLLYALIPPQLLSNPDYVSQTINDVGLGFSLLFALNLSLLLNRLFGGAAALFIAIGFLFSPLVMPFLASGHPFIGACAFLFLACWLLLLSAPPARPARRALFLLLALLALITSLTLRGDIALVLPFVPAMYWADRRQALSACWRELGLATLVTALGFSGFLILQHPYVAAHGGASATLMDFIDKFIALDRLARGLAVFFMTLGLATIAAVVLSGARMMQRRPLRKTMVLALLLLFLPSLLFWLANPQPARHFLFPALALIMLIGAVWADKMTSLKRAAGFALALVIANQLLAEALRPVIVSHYQWSYPSDGIRRATQQVPIGLFPLDQLANRATQSVFHAEAGRLAASQPQQLIFMGDTREYVVAALLAADPGLRLTLVKIGPQDAWLFSHGARRIYVMDKRFIWPRDALAMLLATPGYDRYPIYQQPATLSRYDRTAVPASRHYQSTL